MGMDNSAGTIPVADRATIRRRAVFGPLTGVLNPIVVRFAGTAWFPMVGILHHRGRRSGRAYATPLATSGFDGGFLVPLTFGAQADWCRNVLAAGGCDIVWKGTRWTATGPEVVEAAGARAELRAAMGPVTRFLIRTMGTRSFLRLRVAASERSR